MFAGAVWSIEEPIMKNSELRISAIRERAAASQLNQYGEQYLVDLISLVDTQLGPDADTVVEFGTGVSTLILSEALSQRNQTAGTAPVLLSIHHVGDRQREVASALHCWPFLQLRTHGLSSAMESRAEADFDYATSPYLLHGWVDLAYVGGAVRANCVLAIVPILKDGGSIILNQAEHQGHQFLDGYFEQVKVRGCFKVYARPKVPGLNLTRRLSQQTLGILRVIQGGQAAAEAAGTRSSVER